MHEELVDWLARALVAVYVRPADGFHRRAPGEASNDPSRRARAVAEYINWCVRGAADAGVPPSVIERRLLEWRTQFGVKLTGNATLEDALEAVDVSLRNPSRRPLPHVLVNFATDHWYLVAPTLALVATVAFGAAYRSFYDKLGLTPTDVGLEPAQFVAGSIGGAIVLFVTLAAAMLGFFAPFYVLIPGFLARMDIDSRYRFATVLPNRQGWGIVFLATVVSWLTLAVFMDSAALALVAALVLLAWAVTTSFPPGWLRVTASAVTGVTLIAIFTETSTLDPWLLLGLLLGAVDLLTPRVTSWWRRRRGTQAPPVVEVPVVLTRAREYRILISVVTVIALVLVSISLPLLARDAAADILDGNEVTSVDVFGVPFLDVEARAVTARWKEPSAAAAGAIESVAIPNIGGTTSDELVPQIPGCVFYLGRDSGGTMVLYQVERADSLATPGRPLPRIVRRRALRVSPDDILLISDNRQCNRDTE